MASKETTISVIKPKPFENLVEFAVEKPKGEMNPGHSNDPTPSTVSNI